MTRSADWYFDYLSPYPYLQMSRFGEPPGDLEIRPVPVVFAALLNHWGHKGPAEIPKKRRQTAIYTQWLATRRGLAFAGPPRHPFNPLPLLRLTIAAGCTLEVVRTIYGHVWGEGNDAQEPASVAAVAARLGVSDVEAAINDPAVKDQLRANTEQALALGVFGVPTFAFAGEIFWGDDVTELFAAFLADPGMFARPPFDDIESVTPAAVRIPR